MCLQFGFVIFWRKDFGAKAAHKMLVKLTPGGDSWQQIIPHFNSLIGPTSFGLKSFIRLTDIWPKDIWSIGIFSNSDLANGHLANIHLANRHLAKIH
jgi:hypothetical protein